ncbi:NUDIX domain-containing protein [Sphingobium mellinum]|uniref:NUDIX domain-containing protein n=1 Tax=Sphingobium mellinum TaxID=1387166 RepID=UPI0030EC89FB
MAMTNESAGLLAYRWRGQRLEVFLTHPGGPYWRRKDEGAWQLPKGGILPGETLLNAALREFEEEIGTRPAGEAWPLVRIRQTGGKWVEVFAMETDIDPDTVASNSFEMEWPPRSGTMASFPEVDRAA